MDMDLDEGKLWFVLYYVVFEKKLIKLKKKLKFLRKRLELEWRERGRRVNKRIFMFFLK